MQIPGAPPGCPAPDMGVSREVVAVWVASHILLKIVASDTHHALVVAKSLQQFITEAEKRCCRQTVILKNDPLFLPFEKPRDCAADGVAAAEIAVAKKGADVTRPVDGRGNPPSLFAALRLARSFGPRAVRRHVEPRRPRRPDCFEHCRGRIRPVEDKKEYRGIHLNRYSLSWCGSVATNSHRAGGIGSPSSRDVAQVDPIYPPRHKWIQSPVLCDQDLDRIASRARF